MRSSEAVGRVYVTPLTSGFGFIGKQANKHTKKSKRHRSFRPNCSLGQRNFVCVHVFFFFVCVYKGRAFFFSVSFHFGFISEEGKRSSVKKKKKYDEEMKRLQSSSNAAVTFCISWLSQCPQALPFFAVALKNKTSLPISDSVCI